MKFLKLTISAFIITTLIQAADSKLNTEELSTVQQHNLNYQLLAESKKENSDPFGFLSQGANPNTQDSFGNSPLHYAALTENIDAMQTLLNKGADPITKNAKNQTPLDFFQQNHKLTALHTAATKGDSKTIATLARIGADVDTLEPTGNTPMHYAALKGNATTIKTLIDHGAYANSTNSQGLTPLHLAAQSGHSDAVKALLDNGADLNVQDKNGNTPLHFAVLKQDMNAVKALIAHGANASIQNNNGKPAIDFSSNSKFNVDATTQYKASTQYRKQKMTEKAIGAIKTEQSKKFFDNLSSPEANVTMNLNWQDELGKTALHHAAETNDFLAASSLLSYGADPQIKDKNGNTAFHAAAHNGNTDMMDMLGYKALQTHGIAETMMQEKNNNGETPRVAYQNYLRKTGVDLAKTNLRGKVRPFWTESTDEGAGPFARGKISYLPKNSPYHRSSVLDNSTYRDEHGELIFG